MERIQLLFDQRQYYQDNTIAGVGQCCHALLLRTRIDHNTDLLYSGKNRTKKSYVKKDYLPDQTPWHHIYCQDTSQLYLELIRVLNFFPKYFYRKMVIRFTLSDYDFSLIFGTTFF